MNVRRGRGKLVWELEKGYWHKTERGYISPSVLKQGQSNAGIDRILRNRSCHYLILKPQTVPNPTVSVWKCLMILNSLYSFFPEYAVIWLNHGTIYICVLLIEVNFFPSFVFTIYISNHSWMHVHITPLMSQVTEIKWPNLRGGLITETGQI